MKQPAASDTAASPPGYFPPPGEDWAVLSPEEAGLDANGIAGAVAFAQAHESTRWPRHMVNEQGQYYESGFTDQPRWNELLGPVRPHEGPHGLILRHGQLVARWGDVARADMTFSISKSYLALAALLAVQQGKIAGLHDPVRDYGLDDGFEAPQNRAITWHHLLNQTSEWEGTLWDKPDLVDRNREIGGDNKEKGSHRDLQPPGSYWEYNDVRVNRLSLSLTRLFGRSLHEVLKEHLLDPIGCSESLEWPAYRNAVIEIGGNPVPAVPGGGHWGGGLWINSLDHARMAWLVANRGSWAGRELLSAELVELLRTPATGYANYGYLWWLNTGRALLPAAPESSLLARGAGTHLIWIDGEHDLILVSRWVDSGHWPELVEKILAALRG